MPPRTGSMNKNKQFLLNRLEEMYDKDFHPIMQIAKNCVELQKAADDIEDKDKDKKAIALKSANAEWSRIAEYTEPKLKAIEIDANLSHNLHEDLLDYLDEHT